jgi:hypothetical protein
VEVVVGEHSTVEHRGPECAFGGEVAGVEHDDMSHDSHLTMLPARGAVPDRADGPFRRTDASAVTA